MKKLFTSPQALSLTGNLLASFAGFLNIWILARILSPGDLGKWMVFLTAFTFFEMLRSGVIHTAFIRTYFTQKDKSMYGSAWLIGVILSFLLSSIVYIIFIAVPGFISLSQFTECKNYLPLLTLASLPLSIALCFQQAENRFNHILYLRLALSLPFLLFVVSGFFLTFTLERLMQVYILCYLLASIIAILSGWAHINAIFHTNISTIRKLLQFGKYSMGTLISTNILKSSDTFMIQWYLGNPAVAMYTLPYKLIELVEIPLRSFAATALPQMSRYSVENDKSSIQSIFYQYVGFLTILLIPIVISGFLFAEEIFTLIAGNSYTTSASVFRCFLVYSLFLPLDRFLGITLDSMNKPHYNFIKVCLMVLINISANVFVLENFESSLAVAGTTILTISCGVIIGLFFLKKLVPVHLKDIAGKGYEMIHQNIRKHLFSQV